MRKRFFLLFFLLVPLAVGVSAKRNQYSFLTHVPGVNSVGVRVGTGWFNGVTAGLTYNYYFHKRWSFLAGVDYEWGRFDRSDLHSVTLRPGFEACPWQPARWCFMHLTGGALVSYDMWRQRDLAKRNDGAAVGAWLGLNFEFYAKPYLSILVQAEQSWRYSWLKEGNYNYFSPFFGIGLRYNIMSK